MPRTARIKVQFTADTKTMTFSVPAISRAQAFNTLGARLISAAGIDEAMLGGSGSANPTNGQFDVS
jgi:hypothetical protein